MGRQLRPSPPAWCYPSSMEFECPTCGAEPGEECEPGYGNMEGGHRIDVKGGHRVHRARAQVRGAESLARVLAWQSSTSQTGSKREADARCLSTYCRVVTYLWMSGHGCPGCHIAGVPILSDEEA